MIIECPNCNKKFNLDEKLIPYTGRSLKCSVCGHIWHYEILSSDTKKDQFYTEIKKKNTNINISKIDKKEKVNKETVENNNFSKISDKILSNEKTKNNKKTENKNEIKGKMILVNLIIILISLLSLILLLDTFKTSLSNIFPSIIPLFESLNETLLDLKLFFKDLIN